MDEQLDQAVLDIEEIETDADDDYLSILREMQQSLSDDDGSKTLLKTASNAAALPVEMAAETMTSPLPPIENMRADGGFAGSGSENSQAADYLANAATQPLPELPTDFNLGLLSGSSSANGAETATNEEAETNANSSGSSPVSDEDSFSLAIASLESVAQTSVEEAANGAEKGDQAFDDFAEISPILFDTRGQQSEPVEPDFESDLSLPTSMEMMPEMATDDLFGMADEMPTNLAFSGMFDDDSGESNSAFVPPLEADEETAAEINLLSDGLKSENLNRTESFSELTAPNFEQNLHEQNLSAGLNEKINETLANDDLTDLDLPNAMFLTEKESTFTPEPTFALLDSEQEEEQGSTDESNKFGFPEADLEEADTNGLNLTVPWFLQDELTAKSSSIEESFPEPSFSEESLADEAATAKLPAITEDISGVSAIDENNNGNKLEAENAAHHDVLSQNGFNKFTSPEETADEMPETAFFESLAAKFSETEYPEDLPENFLVSPLDDETGGLPDALSDEMPEAMLLNGSSTSMPEMDLAGLDDALPEPTFEDVDLSLPEPQVDSAPNLSEQNSANQKVASETQSIQEKFSFLEERFVIFKLDDTLYAFPAVNVAEIGQLLPITPLPFVPSWFLGISHLRGDILSVVGLRELWKKNTAPPHKAKILIVHSEKQSLTVALVVDAVREMRRVMPEEIISDEPQSDSHFAPYQIGRVEYEGQNLCLLNAEKLLETLRK